MKKRSKAKKKQNRKNDQSIAQSMLLSMEEKLGLADLFQGELTHLSFDCPLNLREAFKKVTKANGTSICKELQKYMLGYIVANHAKKHAFGDTLSKVLKPEVVIENLSSVQYIQNRPRRLMRQVPSEILTSDGALTCQIGSCCKEAVGKAVYLKTGKEYRVCVAHLENYSDCSQAWRIIA
jgi:hypothetical protein